MQLFVSISVHSCVIMTVRATGADRANNPHQHVTNYLSASKTRIYPRTIVNIVYSVHRHVRVSKVADVCDVSIQCPYTDVIVVVMYMTRAVNIVYSSSHDFTVPIYGYAIFCRIHVLYMTRAVNLTL